MASLSGQINIQELTDLGALAAGYRLYTYTAGTTTHKTVYLDADATIPHVYTSDGLGGQYIGLNDRGEVDGNVYFSSGAYDLTLKTPAGATIKTRRADPAGATNGRLSGAFFVQNGADIQRLTDRLFVGGAVTNDGRFPNVAQDWLTQFQLAAGLSSGTVVSSQFAALNTGTSETGAVGMVGGIQSKYFQSAGTSGIGISSFAVNNNDTLSTNAWAFYGEAHKLTAAVGSVYGIEVDTRTLIDTISPTPFQQGNVIGLQIASGCELSATGQYDASAAIQIAPNPKKFRVGINFLATALTGSDGTSGSAIALALANYQSATWFNSAGEAAGSITATTATAANKTGLSFTDSGLQVSSSDGRALAYFFPVVSADNYLTFTAAIAGSQPTIAVGGDDTNIDMILTTKGTGLVELGNSANFAANGSVATVLGSVGPTGSHTTVQKWLKFKDDTGTVLYIPAF